MPDINVVCERLTVGGLPTRFEDQARLPVSTLAFAGQQLPVKLSRPSPPVVDPPLL